MKKIFLFLLFLINSIAFGQKTDKYWVFFKERELKSTPNVSVIAVENRRQMGLEINQTTDFGPKNEDLLKLVKGNIEVCNTSKWFNAVSAYLSREELAWLKTQSYVLGLRQISSAPSLASLNITPLEEYYLPFFLTQIHGKVFIENNLLGQNVSIGLIDGGFYNAHKDKDLTHLFENERILDYKDFASPLKKDFFVEKETESDFHGTAVLKGIGGRNTTDKVFFGLATESSFYLARTESSKSESRVEEDNWIAAIEWLDSLGVRLVNSSLGYSTGFTNPAENYAPSDMNGLKTVIAKGAQMAVNQKGMIIVVSAGNEGENQKWGGLISTPADVEGVISVASNNEQGNKMPYSSIGPSGNTFIKPDISVYSLYGTSFAAPIITGFIAPILQQNPYMTSKEVKSLIEKSGDLFPFKNNYLGFGFPDARVVMGAKPDFVVKKYKFRKKAIIKNIDAEHIAIFHKSDPHIVISQDAIAAKEHIITIEKPEGVKYTTLRYGKNLVEITWR